MLTFDDLTRRRAVYHVKATAPLKLVVITPKLEGAKLIAPADATEAEGRYRVPFDVKPGEQTFAVTQERTDTRLVALAGLAEADLAVYAKSGAIDDATRKSLEKLASLRAAEAEAERAVGEAQSRIGAITADQMRLKTLLGAVAAGSDLAKRYLAKLDADETELDAGRAAQDQRRKARDAARQAVESFVAGL